MTLLLMALIPTTAYALLLVAHALTTWRHSKSQPRETVLIDIATISAYGLLAGFYTHLIAEALHA